MIACVAVPYFAAAVERRHDAALARAPLVLGGQPWETRPVYGYSREAARKGVHPGMPLRQAHMIFPDSRFLPADATRYHQADTETQQVLADFTPLMEPEARWHPAPRAPLATGDFLLPARYYLDLEGLPPRESVPLLQHLGRTLRDETALPPAIGLATHKFAAQVAATLARPSRIRAVPSGTEAAFLAARPLRYLPLDRETARRLWLLGVRTLGELAALPRSAMLAQFGPEMAHWHRLAQGEGVWPVRPPAPNPVLAVSYRFEPPVANSETLAAVLARAAADLADRLAAAGREGRALQVRWELADGQVETQTRLLPHPTAGAGRLARGLQALLAQATALTAAPTMPVAGVAVQLGRLTPARATQLSLFTAIPRPAGAAGGAAGAPAGRDGLARRLADLLARYGAGPFYRVTLAAPGHPLPEQRARWEAA